MKIVFIFLVVLSLATFGCNQTSYANQRTTAHVINMSPSGKKWLLNYLEKHFKTKFEIINPTNLDYNKNLTTALGTLAEIIPKLPKYKEKTNDHIKIICKFIQNEMDPAIPIEKRSQHIFFVVKETKGASDLSMAYYMPIVADSTSGDGIVWPEFTTYASNDVLIMMMAHEIDHALTCRTYMLQHSMSKHEFAQKIKKDKKLMFHIEESGWMTTIRLFNFLNKSGAINSNPKRPLVDLLFFKRLAEAVEAFNGGQKTWENFIKDNIYK